VNFHVSRRATAWFLLAIPLFLSLPPAIHGPVNGHDEGIWLGTLQGLIDGKRLYRDIAFQYGPLAAFPLKVLSCNSTITLDNVRLTFWLMNVAGLTIVCLAACGLLSSRRLQFFGVIFLSLVPFAAHVPAPMAARYGAGFLPALLWPNLATGGAIGRKYIIACGSVAALAFWVSPEVGVAAVISTGFLCLAGEPNYRRAAEYALGVGLVIGAGVAILMALGMWRGFRFSVIVDNARLVGEQRLPFPSWHPEFWAQASAGRRSWLDPWLNLAIVSAVYLPTMTYTGALLAYRRLRLHPTGRLALGMALYGLLAQVSTFGRSDIWHIYFAVSPVFLVWLLLLDARQPLSSQGTIRWQLAYIIAAAAMTLPLFAAHHRQQQILSTVDRSSALPRLGHSQVPDAQARGFEYLADWIAKHTSVGQPFLFYPYNGAIYFLVNRPNPTRYPLLINTMNEPGEQAEVIRDLAAQNVRWIVWDQRDTVFSSAPIGQLLGVIEQYIQSHYTRAGAMGDFEFWRRADETTIPTDRKM